MELSDGGNKGTNGRGLSGDGVRGVERKGVTLSSLRNAPSMTVFVVGSVSTRLSLEKDVEELIRKIWGRRVLCGVAGVLCDELGD